MSRKCYKKPILRHAIERLREVAKMKYRGTPGRKKENTSDIQRMINGYGRKAKFRGRPPKGGKVTEVKP